MTDRLPGAGHTGKLHDTPEDAFRHIQALYDAEVGRLLDAWRAFARGEAAGEATVVAHYPLVRLVVTKVAAVDPLASFGFLAEPGRYATTLTRPGLFKSYLLEQFALLRRHHDVPLEVGLSSTAIPVQFAQPEDGHMEAEMPRDRRAAFRERFVAPSAGAAIDDGIVDGRRRTRDDGSLPLALFAAPRIDLSIHRLRHYTGTSAAWFQKFVIFTNYDFYMEEFRRIALEEICAPASQAGADTDQARERRTGYQAFVEPGNRVTRNPGFAGPVAGLADGHNGAVPATESGPVRMPQMPAYHLVRPDGLGLTMVNIGVGPSNAKTITDHIAVLRPHAWIMAGHCGGLSLTQQLGDYVLAHAYLRDDKVLDRFLPLAVPVPALAEVQQALVTAAADVTGLKGDALRRVVRTGTVVTTDDRNWEQDDPDDLVRRFNASRAIAIDMESATIAANGYRLGVPYGTLLCVSDKPMHGTPKLPGMASDFYAERKEQHTRIAMRAMELLRDEFGPAVFSRKLMRFLPVAFR